MDARCNSRRMLRVLLLFTAISFSGVSAHAATEVYPLRIRILSAETRALASEPQVPKDCDLQNFSAYCNESRNPSSQSLMLVQDSDGKPFGIACTTDSRWSKCAPLPVGATFDARKEKHGLTILYRDSKGKEVKQSYQLVATTAVPPVGASQLAASRVATQSGTAPNSAAEAATSPGPGWVQVVNPEKVRCNFSSTPPGAEITVDGRYVGNTPSEVGLSTGTHTVVFALSGFSQWKRDLAVLPGSDLNVSAVLQK